MNLMVQPTDYYLLMTMQPPPRRHHHEPPARPAREPIGARIRGFLMRTTLGPLTIEPVFGDRRWGPWTVTR